MSGIIDEGGKSGEFRIAIAGLGTVGAGVVKLLQDNADVVGKRAGKEIKIVAVSARSRGKDRGCDLSGYEWYENPLDLCGLENCDAIIEMIGGDEGIAKDLVEKSMKSGKNVVTANKALLAKHGNELAKIADEKNVALAYEAAVAGGIPVIKTLREGFAANKIESVHGILNGTCNYILSEMEASGRCYDDVLKEAQEKGFAEADPELDVGGYDAAHKLAILTSIAFGVFPDFDKLRVDGIQQVTAEDIRFAGELGYAIRLLGIAREVSDCEDCGIVQMVEPCLVSKDGVVGSVCGAYNAIQIKGDFLGDSTSIGLGAGAGPTASAVVSDIVDLARGCKLNCFGLPVSELREAKWADVGMLRSRFYLRLNVLDKPGVLADVSAILRDRDISIASLLQYGRDPGQPVAVVLLTHEAKQGDMAYACENIASLSSVIESPCALRIENL